jgi:hypothetical protein
MEIGDWGNDTRQGKVKVNVVKVVQPAKRDAGKLKSRRGEDTVVGHKNLNKSMQVEGHYGNLYDKQGPSAVASKGRGD